MVHFSSPTLGQTVVDGRKGSELVASSAQAFSPSPVLDVPLIAGEARAKQPNNAHCMGKHVPDTRQGPKISVGGGGWGGGVGKGADCLRLRTMLCKLQVACWPIFHSLYPFSSATIQFPASLQQAMCTSFGLIIIIRGKKTQMKKRLADEM